VIHRGIKIPVLKVFFVGLQTHWAEVEICRLICNYIMRGFILLVSLISLAINAGAQGYFWQSAPEEKKSKNWSIDAGVGTRVYYGDIQTKGSLFNKVKLAYGIGGRYQFSPRLGLALSAAGRGYAGHANHGGFPDAVGDMTGKLWQGSLQVQYSWLKWEDFTRRSFTERDPVTKGNAYLAAGFGGSLFSASFTDRTYKTQIFKDSLNRDSIVKIAVDKGDPANGFGMYVPVVLGFRYRFTPVWSLTLETQYQFYITKNIDGLASKKFDKMLYSTVRLGYTFGQTRKKGAAKAPKRKGK